MLNIVYLLIFTTNFKLKDLSSIVRLINTRSAYNYFDLGIHFYAVHLYFVFVLFSLRMFMTSYDSYDFHLYYIRTLVAD